MRLSFAVLCAVGSGVLLACAYPPFGLGFIAYVALVPLLVCTERLSSRNVFFLAFLSGLVFHVITLSWIRYTTWGGMIAAIIALSFFYTLPFAATSLIRTVFYGWWILYFPFALAGFEWIRSFDRIAFPWMIIGNSQTSYPWLIQFADITSVFGVSFWVASINCTLFMLIKRRTRGLATLLALLFIVPLVYSWNVMRTPSGTGKELTVTLVQGNVVPDDKWGEGKELWNVALYCSLSTAGMTKKPDLIIWPETAIPVYLLETPRCRWLIHAFVDSIGVPLLTGMPAMDFESDKIWNSSGLFLPGESDVERYHKIHLVPFGESIPLSSFFPKLKKIDLGQANWDNGVKKVVFRTAVLPPFNVAICFESIFPDLIRKFVVKGSQFIVVITNDVWGGPTFLPIQHAMIAVMRAIEFHRPVVRCANTGISMLIDPFGRIKGQTDTFVRTTLTGVITPSAVQTIYARYGNVFGMFCFCLAVFFLILYAVVKRLKIWESQ